MSFLVELRLRNGLYCVEWGVKLYSLTHSFLLKTLERLVDRFIRDDTLIKYPLNENQHAYMAGKSTDTALHVLVGKIEKALYNKEYALSVFLDIEGAFNNECIHRLPLERFTFKKG